MKKIYLLLVTLLASFSMDAQVVISQIYGAGNNTGATYRNDFIEIFNRGSVQQGLWGCTVQ